MKPSNDPNIQYEDQSIREIDELLSHAPRVSMPLPLKQSILQQIPNDRPLWIDALPLAVAALFVLLIVTCSGGQAAIQLFEVISRMLTIIARSGLFIASCVSAIGITVSAYILSRPQIE